jgi:hypothetical protein
MRKWQIYFSLAFLLAGFANPTLALANAPVEGPEGYLLLAQQEGDADATDDSSAAEDGEEPELYPEPFVFARIPVTFPVSAEAPGLREFLASLQAVAVKHDQAALTSVVAPKIFWDRDFGGGYDENATGSTNFLQAMQIGIPDVLPEYADDGWVRLANILASGRFSVEPDQPGAYCSPVFPALADAAAAEAVFVKVNMGEDEWRLYWGYVDGKADVRQEGKADAAVIANIENEAVPVHAWDFDNLGFVEIGLPDGRHGFVKAGLVGSWVDERVCVGQSGDKWEVNGYVGGGD